MGVSGSHEAGTGRGGAWRVPCWPGQRQEEPDLRSPSSQRVGCSVINCCAVLHMSCGIAVFDVWGRRPERDFPPLLGLILLCLLQPFDSKALQINLLSHQQTAGTDQKDDAGPSAWGRERI